LHVTQFDHQALARRYAGFALERTDLASGALAIESSVDSLFTGLLVPLLNSQIAAAQLPLTAFGLSLFGFRMLGTGVITCTPSGMEPSIFAMGTQIFGPPRNGFAIGGFIAGEGGVVRTPAPVGNPAEMQDMLAAHAEDSNVAITLTQEGLNAHLARMLADQSL